MNLFGAPSPQQPRRIRDKDKGRDRDSKREPDSERDRERRKKRSSRRDLDRSRSRSRSRDENRRKDTDRERRRRSVTDRPPTERKVSNTSSTRSRRSDESRRKKESGESLDHRDKPAYFSEPQSRATKMAHVVPEMARRGSNGSPASSRYPSLSKAHAKEAVASREDVSGPRISVYTPDPTNTDVGNRKPTPMRTSFATSAGVAPPSPPLTAADDLAPNRPRSGNSMRRTPEPLDLSSSRPASVDPLRARVRSSSGTAAPSRTGNGHRKADSTGHAKAFGELKSGPRHVASDGGLAAKLASKGSRNFTPQAEFSVISEAASESTARSLSPKKEKRSKQYPVAAVVVDESSLSAGDSSPRTPTPCDAVFPMDIKDVPFASIPPPPPPPAVFPVGVVSQPVSVINMNAGAVPPPPPPPPPALAPLEVPRVDYLLLNGGLQHLVPRSFLAAIQPNLPPAASNPYSTVYDVPPSPANNTVSAMFAPFLGVLDDYRRVLEKNGSLAVATGYRSVARRLLDRLEAVFNRNISSEACDCVMCRAEDHDDDGYDEERDTGVSWGEILEYVSGRRDLPQWPPFTITTENLQSKPSLDAPFTKMDIDVPEEYRDHYIKQGRKTKQTVQNWLRSQPDMPSSPPQEIDDETLTFTMVTHLEPENRRLFTALIRGLSAVPQSRAPTPLNTIKPELMTKTALALQRLYRLASPPRDPENAMYLLKYPGLHNVLATLSAISAGEWDILTSGRFDGFLWSGAEASGYPPANNSGAMSRGPTPAIGQSPLRNVYDANHDAAGVFRSGTPLTHPGVTGTPLPYGSPATPGPNGSSANRFGAPVQLDEDNEIAVLAEMEREIYNGMEALEDAFEALHTKAESVRSLLRSRGAGLSLAASARRGESIDGPVATTGTPFSMNGMYSPAFGSPNFPPGGTGLSAEELAKWRAQQQDDDWFTMHAGKSDLGPDDSASNVSHRRRRKKSRAKELEERIRRTPAPVEEVDEEEAE